jgi:hypothetical protein
MYPQTAGGYPISLETTSTPGQGISSRITLINCDTFQFNGQANNTYIHAFTNTDANTVTNSYTNDVFTTASVADLVVNVNTAMKAGAGVTHVLYAGQPVGEGNYPLFVANASNMKGRLFYTGRGITATLAGSATENIFNMGTTSGVYQVTAQQSDGGIVWTASAEVFFNGASLSSVYTKVSTNVTVTTSGSQIVLTNTSMVSQALRWTVQRLNA